eukprot:gb/GEZN01010404.1/.p1 GENE.gb/GEZN01010404.1/~~gb/GEZN01010404.1/.p1  ORF type:complete len:354 (+),score=36.85 gb/GEZN01010404.1/:156-1217(+)
MPGFGNLVSVETVQMSKSVFSREFGENTLVALHQVNSDNKEDKGFYAVCRLKSLNDQGECAVEDVDQPGITIETTISKLRWLFGPSKVWKSSQRVLALWYDDRDQSWTSCYYPGKLKKRGGEFFVVFDTEGEQHLKRAEVDVSVNNNLEVYSLPIVISHTAIDWKSVWLPAAKSSALPKQKAVWIPELSTSSAPFSAPSSPSVQSPAESVVGGEADGRVGLKRQGVSCSSTHSSITKDGPQSRKRMKVEPSNSPAPGDVLESETVKREKPVLPKRPFLVTFPRISVILPSPDPALTLADAQLPFADQGDGSTEEADPGLGKIGFKSLLGCLHNWDQLKPLLSQKLVVAPYVAL